MEPSQCFITSILLPDGGAPQGSLVQGTDGVYMACAARAAPTARVQYLRSRSVVYSHYCTVFVAASEGTAPEGNLIQRRRIFLWTH
jgi:hypothetical protein